MKTFLERYLPVGITLVIAAIIGFFSFHIILLGMINEVKSDIRDELAAVKLDVAVIKTNIEYIKKNINDHLKKGHNKSEPMYYLSDEKYTLINKEE